MPDPEDTRSDVFTSTDACRYGPSMWRRLARALFLPLFVLTACSEQEVRRSVPATGYGGWPVYGGGRDGIRYPALAQINKENVGDLEVAWTHDTEDSFKGSETVQPIVVGRLRAACRAAAAGAVAGGAGGDGVRGRVRGGAGWGGVRTRNGRWGLPVATRGDSATVRAANVKLVGFG